MPSSAASGHHSRASLSQASVTIAPRSTSSAPPLQQTRPVEHFEPCTATASFFLYAQRNVIRCLHHDSLAMERKFERHKDDVLLMSADNVSERGAGRLIVSYDVEQTAIVWDLLTGDEVARFASYEAIRVATWMKDGSIAFGNSQGNVILFEPSTSEHISARTIYDPISALAPSSDCTTFAIGYLNGSILIATLQPSFVILHTLSTSRSPSPITGLGWHNSSSKQGTDMLATQTADGDLRIWNVSKDEQPRIIRNIGAPDSLRNHRTWFAWSKNGRIVQFCDGDTRVWDVRTKKVTHEVVPTIDDVLSVAAYGPNGTLFTVGRSYSVQQYDLVSHRTPLMVKNVQYAPPNAPPTPPDLIEESKRSRTVPRTVMPDEPIAEVHIDMESSEEESYAMSPLQKIAQDRNQFEDECRDQVTPLSPMSSRGSLSSASSYNRRRKQQSRSERSAPVSDGSFIMTEPSVTNGAYPVSLQSASAIGSQRQTSSALRYEVIRSPEDQPSAKSMDLFPFVRARLGEVKFRAPHYGKSGLTPEVLRNEMLRVVFGWDGDIEGLIRDEQGRHRPGSASNVLLSKWLGDLGADAMAQLVGSESMTSSDWMLLALSCQMGEGSQKKVGQAFVKRLLETGETHPAVAILLGLGEPNEAVEVYVSRKMYLEAVLLTCLVLPNDWQRQSHLVRRWGESAISHGQAELAVRCFSCTTIESSEPWFSPRSQDAVYQAQHLAFAPHTLSPPASPPVSAAGARLTTKTASLKLVTSFGGHDPTALRQNTDLEATPIVDTAVTPSTHGNRRRDTSRGHRDRSASRTATPGGQRRYLASAAGDYEADFTPLATTRVNSRITTPALREIDSQPDDSNSLSQSHGGPQTPAPGPSQRASSRARSASRNHNSLHISMEPLVEVAGAPHTGISSKSLTSSVARSDISNERSIDRYIDSLNTFGKSGAQQATEGNSRAQSRTGRTGRSGRSRSRAREAEDMLGAQITYMDPNQPSPSSPKPVASDNARDTPVNKASETVVLGERSEPQSAHLRTTTNYATAWSGSPEAHGRRMSVSKIMSATENRAKPAQQVETPVQSHIYAQDSSWHQARSDGSSPTLPSSVAITNDGGDYYSHISDERVATPSRAYPSTSLSGSGLENAAIELRTPQKHFAASSLLTIAAEVATTGTRSRMLTRKEIAARELEERRLSLTRRPSVPNIPHPAELSSPYSRRTPRAGTDPLPLLSSASYVDMRAIARSQTVNPEHLMRAQPSATSTGPVATGLPATPKAMQRANTAQAEHDGYFKQTFAPVITDSPVTLAPATYQSETKPSDAFGPLLPSTVYSKPPIVRSYSAPPEQFSTTRKLSNDSFLRAHARKGSAIEVIPEVSASFEAGVHDGDGDGDDDQIVIVTQSESAGQSLPSSEARGDPPVLAELAHLAGPPPPPPPPTIFHAASPPRTSGVIEILMDDLPSSRTSTSSSPTLAANVPVTPLQHGPSASPMSYRQRTPGPDAPNASGGSGSSPSTGGSGIGSKWRNLGERIRSSSRNRTKSPPMQQDVVARFTASPPAPYETVIGSPPMSYFQVQGIHSQDNEVVGVDMDAMNVLRGASPPTSTGGYRNPKEIRANMPPDMLQAGVGATRLQHEWGRF